MGFNLNDYVEVKDRIQAAHDEFPKCQIRTEIVNIQPIKDTSTGETCNEYVTKAIFTPDPLSEPEVYYTGHAAERDNNGFVNKTSALENCETSAVGRALALAGYGVSHSIASREEVENAQQKQKAIKPTIKSLELIDKLARQCGEEGLMSEDAKIAYSKKRTDGFYDTKVKVARAQSHFEELLNNKKKESVNETGK
jgi:hypothetical protein|tara:strand:- start:739 stop:1326 length:588 start_codon:yes stop_codon:yes gene_type:complete